MIAIDKQLSTDLLERRNTILEQLIHVIAQHHEFDPDSEYIQFTALIQLADMITRKYQVGSGGDDLIPEIDSRIWQTLNINQTELNAWDEDIKTEIEKSQELQDLMLK